MRYVAMDETWVHDDDSALCRKDRIEAMKSKQSRKFHKTSFDGFGKRGKMDIEGQIMYPLTEEENLPETLILAKKQALFHQDNRK